MTHTPNPFSDLAKPALDTYLKSATTAFESVERLIALNLNTARSALEDGSGFVRALLAAKNPTEILDLQSSFAQPLAQKSLAYYRSGYEIVAQSLEECLKPYEAQFAEANKLATIAIEKAARSVPGGGEVAVAAMRSAMATANSTYESVTKATRQAVEITEANVAATADATIKAIEANAAATNKKSD
ncbi:phasin family protein [Azoarcus sp. PA01]|nr:phasin family protein [Azoarcus sp. PA01]